MILGHIFAVMSLFLITSLLPGYSRGLGERDERIYFGVASLKHTYIASHFLSSLPFHGLKYPSIIAIIITASNDLGSR